MKSHGLLLTFHFSLLAQSSFWAIEESGSVVLALFAEQRTVLHIGGWQVSCR